MSPGNKARGGSPPVTLASGGDADDRIGALPDALLHHVLSFVPAQLALQTCVLARRWLHLWKSATGLRVVGADDGKEVVPVRFEDVRVFVDNLLLLRGSSPFETLELKFSGGSIDMTRVMLWIRQAVLCKVRVLLLTILSREDPTSRFQQGEPALVSEHLTQVDLHGIVFNDDDEFLDFSRCPSLQHLNIAMCGFENTRRISSMSLKNLIIFLCSFSSRTRIHAPNNGSLFLLAVRGRIPVLERMPSLVLAIITVFSSCLDTCSRSNDYGGCGDESCHGCIKDDSSSVLLQGLSNAQHLCLTATNTTYVIRRDLKRCPTFGRLKMLILNEYWCVPDIHPLKCILEHSPVLEMLCLLLDQGSKRNVQIEGTLNRKEISSATISAHLTSVRIDCEMVDERVQKVLRFLRKFNICFNFKEKMV